jgi:hypothetical protein
VNDQAGIAATKAETQDMAPAARLEALGFPSYFLLRLFMRRCPRACFMRTDVGLDGKKQVRSSGERLNEALELLLLSFRRKLSEWRRSAR